MISPSSKLGPDVDLIPGFPGMSSLVWVRFALRRISSMLMCGWGGAVPCLGTDPGFFATG